MHGTLWPLTPSQHDSLAILEAFLSLDLHAGNEKALATVTAIIDGMGRCTDLNMPHSCATSTHGLSCCCLCGCAFP